VSSGAAVEGDAGKVARGGEPTGPGMIR